MKSLQKYICTIFLLMAVITGCTPSNPLPKNLKPTPKPSEQPKPDTPKPNPKPDTPKPDHKTNEGKGTGDGKTLTVRFSLTDDHGACMFEEMGNVYSATVKTKNAVLTVTTDPPRGVQVSIDGTETKTKTFTFTENGTTQEAQVKVTYNGSVKDYTVKVRYYTGAIKKLMVTDGNGKAVPVQSLGDTTYTAGVETKKVKVEVETLDSADTVKFEGEETKTKEVEFASGELTKELKAVVTHGGTDETYTIKLYYADPALNPKEPVLTSIVIKNADNPGETFALSPEFLPYNTSYIVKVPASVTKIKIEAAADSGISAEVVNGDEKTLNEGNNPIVVKAIQAANPVNTLSYMIEVRKPKMGASSQAELKSLEMKSKYQGINKDWITPPAMFNKTTETYECTMDSKCDEFYITASPEDSTATMTVKANDGTLAVLDAGTEWKHTPLKKGMNTFIITVTAQDSVTTKTYTIKAKRAEGSFVLKNFSGTGLNDFYNGRFEE